MSELQQILNRLAVLTPNEQKIVNDWIANQQIRKMEQRKKELWGNAIAALKKYEKEIEPINVDAPDRDCIIQYDDCEPGRLVLDCC